MTALLENVLQASFHGSIVILAVLLLRLVLKKAPRKFRSAFLISHAVFWPAHRRA